MTVETMLQPATFRSGHSPSRSAAWFALPALGLTALAILAAARRQMQSGRPTIDRMSDEWLRNYEYTSGQHVDV
jgi:hypothetical protein